MTVIFWVTIIIIIITCPWAINFPDDAFLYIGLNTREQNPHIYFI